MGNSSSFPGFGSCTDSSGNKRNAVSTTILWVLIFLIVIFFLAMVLFLFLWMREKGKLKGMVPMQPK
jgi:flagellar basal body-associated protein FliL